MRLFFNRNTGAITRDAGAGASLSDNDPVFCKRGDAPGLQLAFHRDGTFELPAAPLLDFIVKQLLDYAGDAIIETTSFTTPGDISGFYVLRPDLTGDALLQQLLTGPLKNTVANAAARKALTGLAVGDIVKQTDTAPPTYWRVVDAGQLSADAGWSRQGTFKEFVDFGAEIVLREFPDFGEETSQSFIFRVYSDYERGGETAPTGGTPFSFGLALNRYDITGLTGGGDGNLDGIVTAANAQIPRTLIAVDVVAAAMWWRLRTSPAVTSSSVANPSVITTPAPHGFPNGATVTIGGHTGSTPDINGDHVITVLTSTTFSIPVNVTVAGTGGYATRAEDTAAGIVRPDDFNAATNPVTWQSAL